MEYDFRKIEAYWQDVWKRNGVYKVNNDSPKPKYYVLDMFPYPSGAGLHVGHPLGYIASDIYARFKRLKGFNVLHPMGYDAFGLPAEQYAIEHGIHPAISTAENINNFRKQLDNIGFSFDWDREVRTYDPKYYQWTQWIFLQLFKSFYNRQTDKAEPIDNLIAAFENEGNRNHLIPDSKFQITLLDVKAQTSNSFSADEWKNFDEFTQQTILMEYRLAYCGYGEVNWCEALGTVLANDEVVNGVSERGGYPVEKKKLRQWYLRITEYADRLLEGLERIEFSEAMKEMQSNWIGKSYGAEISFKIQVASDKQGNPLITHHSVLRVYTTRSDTIFGVDFMVIAPEHELIEKITTPEQKQSVDEYIAYVKSRTERERMAEKKITGVFTGAYAINPFNGREIPIWISEYVLAGYGTGAIMAVPCGDERDHKFAKHFGIPITNIIGQYYDGEEANPTKDAILENSDFLNGMLMRDAIDVVNEKIEELGIGKKKVNYKMRDAAFSRQRYWGEPVPIVWKDGGAYPLDENELPLELPYVETYKPGPEGEGPLANIEEWTAKNLETNTMPGYAGSSWYFLRYMDLYNDKEFCSRKASDYWGQVDLYIGGTEHAVGHLLYSRMWTKALYDLGFIGHDEPYKKLVNQGMIQGSSRFVYRLLEKGFEFLFSKVLQNNFHDYYFIGRADSISSKSSLKFDFISEKKNIVIELSNQADISKKYSNAVSLQMPYKLIFISYQELLEKFSLGDDVILTWLKNVIEFDENYLSPETTNCSLFISKAQLVNFKEDEYSSMHVNVDIVNGVHLELDNFRNYKEEYQNAIFLLEDGSWLVLNEQKNNPVYICGSEVEKMSKSKFNTVNPNEVVEKYGADTFRMYEMFLGPVEQSKPWDTKGIEGVYRFLRKLWRLFYDEQKGKVWIEEKATDAELKALHKAIKKIEEDTERFSFNTAVSAFMVCVNELTDLKCSKKEILEPLLILLSPYAPHVAEELWHALGNESTILDSAFPQFEEKYLIENTKEYPVSVNGKVRTQLNLSLDISRDEVEKIVMDNVVVKKWLDGKQPKKLIFVPGKMINVVV